MFDDEKGEKKNSKTLSSPLHSFSFSLSLQAKLARNEVTWVRRVYFGETIEGRTPTLREACAASTAASGGKAAAVPLPTLGQFRHLTAVVASYAFHLPDDEGTHRTIMLPLLDLINHANAGLANAVVAREDGEFTARALRDINKGEEVRVFFEEKKSKEVKKTSFETLFRGF